MNKNRGQPQTMRGGWLVLDGCQPLPPALGKTMGSLTLVVTQLPFFAVVISSVKHLLGVQSSLGVGGREGSESLSVL